MAVSVMKNMIVGLIKPGPDERQLPAGTQPDG